MPNNLVFNTVASELMTQIFGYDGTTVRPVAVDSAGQVLVAGTITANLATVTAVVASGTVTVAGGTVTALLSTVTAVVASGTVTATVASGTITALLSTVTAVVASGTVTAFTQVNFTESNTTVAIPLATTVTAMTQDTSLTSAVSFYVQNTSAILFSAVLQVSPVNTEGFYVNDGAVVSVAGSTQTVLVPSKFMKFSRVLVGSSLTPASAAVYYNAQS